jgi:hypothetical protein
VFQSLLQEVANKAAQDRAYRFHDCLGWLTVEILCLCWGLIRKNLFGELSRLSADQFDKDLQGNIAKLEHQLMQRTFKADVGGSTFIPKVGGGARLIGLSSVEDRILQFAVSKILFAIYKYEFLPNCHGFRPGIGAFVPIKALTAELVSGRYTMLVEASVKGYVNTINHELLIEMLGKRIADHAFLNLIKQWLQASYPDTDGKKRKMSTGLRQGEYLTLILSSVYMHYAVDLWLNDYAKNYCRGAVYFCRYSYDIGVAFEYAEDADRLFHALTARLEHYGLQSNAKLRLWSLDYMTAWAAH